MNWREVLLEALKDPEELRRMAELARQYRVIEAPGFDYKARQAGEKEEDK